MNFEFSEEQTMIKDSVTRFVREQYDFDTRRGIVESAEGINRVFLVNVCRAWMVVSAVCRGIRWFWWQCR